MQRLDLIAVDRKALLQHDLAHIGRVDRKPALTIDVHLGGPLVEGVGAEVPVKENSKEAK